MESLPYIILLFCESSYNLQHNLFRLMNNKGECVHVGMYIYVNCTLENKLCKFVVIVCLKDDFPFPR